MYKLNNNYQSTVFNISTGIPQGSILDPCYLAFTSMTNMNNMDNNTELLAHQVVYSSLSHLIMSILEGLDCL